MILAVEVEHDRRRLATQVGAVVAAGGAPLVELGLGAERPPDEIVGGAEHFAQELDGAIAIGALGGEHFVHGRTQLVGHAVKHATQYRAAAPRVKPTAPR